ncbi:hypothetical protein PCANC_22712 [Puccinia coronata f. sp. avenae]|uniref:Uncharacterized protein n=1 Tax=Puccinia coronata f. sp. avenae TaxID=200324 RepID=A0A2N5S638_9BASI|nr:hypothetical protein PCANC_22712 [Puccinia coronata f. sp. avenae]
MADTLYRLAGTARGARALGLAAAQAGGLRLEMATLLWRLALQGAPATPGLPGPPKREECV